MKRLFLLGLLGMTMNMQAAEVDTLKSVELQDIQVVATRATKKTPVAYTNMSQEQLKSVNFGQDVRNRSQPYQHHRQRHPHE